MVYWFRWSQDRADRHRMSSEEVIMRHLEEIIEVLCELRAKSYAAGRLPERIVRTTVYSGRYGHGWTLEYNDPADEDMKRHVVEYWTLDTHNGFEARYLAKREGLNGRLIMQTVSPEWIVRKIDEELKEDREVVLDEWVSGAEWDLIELLFESNY